MSLHEKGFQIVGSLAGRKIDDLAAARKRILRWVDEEQGLRNFLRVEHGDLPAYHMDVEKFLEGPQASWGMRVQAPEKRGGQWMLDTTLSWDRQTGRIGFAFNAALKNSDPNFVPQLVAPSFVVDLCEKMGLRDDSTTWEQRKTKPGRTWPFLTRPHIITTNDEAISLALFVAEEGERSRRAPVIVIGAAPQGEARTLSETQMSELSRRTAGLAHVVCLETDRLEEDFSHALYARTQRDRVGISDGAVRIYSAGDSFRDKYANKKHPIFARAAIQARDTDEEQIPTVDYLCLEVKNFLPHTPLPGHLRFGAIRRARLQAESKAHQQARGTSTTSDAVAADTMPSLRKHWSGASVEVAYPQSSKDLPDWVKQHLGDRLVLHDKTVDHLHRHPIAPEKLATVCNGLLLLGREYYDMIAAGSGDQRPQMRKIYLGASEEINMRVIPTTTDQSPMRSSSDYYASWDGGSRFSERVLQKKGGLRIYLLDPDVTMNPPQRTPERPKVLVVTHLPERLSVGIK